MFRIDEQLFSSQKRHLAMITRRLLATFAFTFVASLTATPLAASDFSFTSIIQAGARGLGAAGWEIGTGADQSSITSGTQYRYTPGLLGWSNNLTQQFTISYNQATNTATTTVWGSTGTPYVSSYNPPAGVPQVDRIWTINANALNVNADPAVVAPTSIQVSQLQLGSGLVVIQPLSVTTLYASQPSGTSNAGNSSAVVFTAFANGGNWNLDGVIQFSGLRAYAANGALNSGLQFSLTASASDSPEPAAVLLVSGGLAAMAYYKRRRKQQLA